MLAGWGQSRAEMISNGEVDTESGTSTKKKREDKEEDKGYLPFSTLHLYLSPFSSSSTTHSLLLVLLLPILAYSFKSSLTATTIILNSKKQNQQCILVFNLNVF